MEDLNIRLYIKLKIRQVLLLDLFPHLTPVLTIKIDENPKTYFGETLVK